MRTLRSVIAAVGVTAAGAAVLVAPGVAQADSGHVQAKSETSVAASKHYYNTWRNAYSYSSTSAASTKKGILWAGSNYFYCQKKGSDTVDEAGNLNNWWAKTDDDNGNTNVWVSVTAFSTGGDWEKIPGLPVC